MKKIGQKKRPGKEPRGLFASRPTPKKIRRRPKKDSRTAIKWIAGLTAGAIGLGILGHRFVERSGTARPLTREKVEQYEKWKREKFPPTPTPVHYKNFTPSPYFGLVQGLSYRYGVDSVLAELIKNRESSNNPKAVGPKGGLGLMQITPIAMEEARKLGIPITKENAFHPYINIKAGCALLERNTKWLRRKSFRLNGKTQKFSSLPKDIRIALVAESHRKGVPTIVQIHDVEKIVGGYGKEIARRYCEIQEIPLETGLLK